MAEAAGLRLKKGGNMKHSRGWMMAAIASAGLLAATPAAAQDVGDWVLSKWRGSSQYFPGVVTERSGRQVKVRFDDGDVDTVFIDMVRPFDWVAGSAVECRWSDGNWFSATIRWMSDNGLTMQVRYDDDGTVERTNTGKCRSL